MSLERSVYITCDVCGEVHQPPPAADRTLADLWVYLEGLGWKAGFTNDLFPGPPKDDGGWEKWHLQFCPTCKDKPYAPKRLSKGE